MRHLAFTVIELLVALALSAIILLTLYMGFRATLGGLTAANRLALENDLLRKGYLTALDEADFWRFHDHPDGDALETQEGRGLRGPAAATIARSDNDLTVGTARQGLPFTPFRNAQNVSHFTAASHAPFAHQPWVGAPAPTATPDDPTVFYQPLDPVASTVDPAREAERGWRSSWHWSAADPRTWYRGNTDQGDNSDLRWGRYALLSHPLGQPTLGSTITGQRRYNLSNENNWAAHAAPSTGSFGTVTVERTWRENQLLGLRYALGHYGLADYLPANAVIGTHGGTTWAAPATVQNDNHEIVFFGWFKYLSLQNGLGNAIGGTNWHFPGPWTVGGRGDMIPLLPRSNYAFWAQPTATMSDAQFARYSARTFSTQATNPGSSTNLSEWSRWSFANTEILRPLLFQKPAAWPDTYIGVSRSFANTAFVNRYRVRLADPVDGRVIEYSFHAWGTTLRGARQQRAYDPANGVTSGWARWYSPGHPNNTPTLDDY